MFGFPNTFGFGSQSLFGQTSNTSTNPFAPKPLGSTTPFGSQTGSSMFGGTATGMFGAPQTSLPFSSNTTFGASSSPAFGSSMPAFGASSTPAFGASSSPAFGATTSAFGGSSSSAFGASSVFGQKPAFGGFGSSQTSPFGSTSQPSQPAFGGSLFGSTSPFGASSQSAFGATSTAPAFGATSSPAFGATSSPAFGATSTPAFGATSTPAFGATSAPAFGSTGSGFGASSTPVFGSSSSSIFGSSTTPAFGASSGPAFGASSTPAFGVSTTPAFGASNTPAFGASSAPAFGASTTPSFSFSSGTTFGQSASTFSSSPFGTTTSQFGTQSSPCGSQTTPSPFGSPGLWQLAFGGQRGGSRVAPYTATNETEGSGGQPGKLESVSAMPVHREKSHEELRWEDYQLGDKGGPHPPNQSSGGIGFSASTSQSNPFASSPAFPQSSAPAPSNPFAPKPSLFAVSTTSAFGTTGFSASSSSSPFTLTPGFGTATSAFTGSTPSLFSTSTSNAFASTPSLISSSTQATSSPFSSGVSFTNTQPSLFQTTATSLGQTGFGPSTTPSFQSNMISTLSTGFSAGLFSSGASQVPFSSSMFSQPTSQPFQLSQPSQPGILFSFSNFGQNQSDNTGVSSIFSQSATGQLPTTQNVAIQPLPATNPFGTLPAMPQISIGRTGTSSSVQYEISSLPVVVKPAPVRISSLLTTRHLLQRRIRFLARKYSPKHGGAKVPFFSDEEEMPSTPKADVVFIPRQNPRDLVIRPTDQLPLRASVEKVSPLKDTTTQVCENGKTSEAGDFSLLNSSVSGDKDRSQTMPSPFGSPGFGQLAFGGQRWGSRVAPYTATNETEGSGGQPGKLESISAMPVHKESSHEELRWEDYQLGDIGNSVCTPAFGVSTTPAFGSSTTPSFSFSSGNTFDQSASTFLSSPFGATTCQFGTQSSPFGRQPTPSPFGSPGFGQLAFWGQHEGSRVAPYTATDEIEGSGGQPGKLESISAMPVYKEKRHEELRWEDYQLGDKASTFSSSPFGTTTCQFGTHSTPFGSQTTPSGPSPFGSPGFGQLAFGGQRGGSRVAPYTATDETEGSGGQPGKLESICGMPAYKEKNHEELRWEDYQLGGKGNSVSTPAFGVLTTPAFGVWTTLSFSFSSGTTFGQSTSTFSSCPFGFTTSPFGAQCSPFGSQTTPSPFGSPGFW